MEYFASAGAIGIIFFLLCILVSFLMGLLWVIAQFSIISTSRSQKKIVKQNEDRNIYLKLIQTELVESNMKIEPELIQTIIKK